jgi:hypothetical protein
MQNCSLHAHRALDVSEKLHDAVDFDVQFPVYSAHYPVEG